MRISQGHDNRQHRAAVITPGTIFYGNGTATPALPDVGRSLLLLLEGTMDRFTEHATIIVDGHMPADMTGHPQIGAVGWQHPAPDAWTIYHRGGRTVSIGLRSAMSVRHFGVLFDRDTDPGVLAMLLDRYHVTTGNPWRGTPSMSALNAIRLTWENGKYQPLWRLPKECVRSSVGPLFWTRPLNDLEREWGYVHTFDGNSAYLGSAISADLTWSRLHHLGAQPFDPSMPGYWLLSLSNQVLALSRDAGRPPLLSRKVRDTCAWMTTPYAKFLMAYGQCDVLDSWTADYRHNDRPDDVDHRKQRALGRRILRAWGENVRDTLTTLHPSVALAVKRTYSNAVGGMQSEHARIYRPDWGHTIIDLWRATLLRRVERIHHEIGYWPVRVATDSISYADSNPDPRVLAAHVGAQLARPYRLGHYHYETTHTTAEWVALHETRRLEKTGAR